VNRELARQVWIRARDRCEYCHLPAAAYPLLFHVDHIIARQHGGETELDNLALACLHCNRHKGPNIAGVDPATGSLSRLFHPRRDEWAGHFEWHGSELCGKTPVGRATIAVLAINDPDIAVVRAELMGEGVYPD
jgi:hypothetical protein